MTFEEEFPSLKKKMCVADGIKCYTSFNIKNAKDLDEAKKILSKQYVTKESLQEHCIDKQRVREFVSKIEGHWESGIPPRVWEGMKKELCLDK